MLDRVSIKMAAKARMKEHRPSVYLVTVVMLIITTILSYLITKLSGLDAISEMLSNIAVAGDEAVLDFFMNSMPKTPAFASVLIAVISIVSAIINVGYMRFSLNTYRCETATYGTLFDDFGHVLKVIWLSILIGIFTFLWSLLFIIPGIIAIFRYSWAYYVMIDNPELSAIECIRESKRLTKGYKMGIFVLGLSFIGWGIIAGIIESVTATLIGITLPLFSIWLTPYMSISDAGMYCERLRLEQGYQEPSAEAEKPDCEL